MLRFFLGLVLATTLPASSFACCAENIYRLFPIGELGDEVIFVEYRLSRYCKINLMGGPENRMAIRGEINLVRTGSDSLQVLLHIDSIDILDREVKVTLEESYQEILKLAEEYPGFTRARTSTIIFNDTANIELREVKVDTVESLFATYGDFFERDMALDVISCFPKIPAEVRNYETDHFEITVLRMRCQTVREEFVEEKKEKFATLETAIWKEPHQYHGTARDYFNIVPKSD